ncbi:15-hydroxyprostaglandin dehydrogenase [NAD(+)] [Seminavis robusta]|uniref:15-hydroxyprostaglandin dehydrogenase [NAD(+)] n=1 Tax=Seminavis robusta TaxID=568900 RepID=A0A9N8H3P6_9STRA|nr:15-hydroxyprostaglandin dehydrogenase [NAD(+)] [Seminavis robusta]|eukprot:Sro93_g048260.1 15-hydroxyprostaglandin dehydrogenase [NAD(+)] (228) ;mRNA; f:7357-8327
MNVALVTGANRGIGKEVCKQLADKGYQVLLGSRSLEKGQQAVQELGHSAITPIQIDVTDQASVDQAAKKIQSKYQKLDVLVNNAGINYDDHERAISVDLQDVQNTMETNLYGPWRCTTAMLPLLHKSNNPRIVNVSSGAGSLSGMSGGTPAYGVSKAALNALTLKLARELSSTMRVNAVCPGWIATDMGGAGGGPIPEGAASVVWACTLDKNGPTGGFFRHGKAIPW